MAENLAWIKFFVGDWRRDPKVAMLSAAGRGVWLEMILTMHDLSDCKIEGTVREIARMCHLDMAEVQSALQELERHGVAEVTWRNDSVTGEAIVTVVSRRLEREEKTRSDARERQKKYRQKKKSQENNKELPSDSDSDSDSDKNKEKVYKPKKDEVEAIYSAYPRKIGKKAAMEKIRIALQGLHEEKGDDNFAYLLDRTRKFAQSPAGKRGEFTPHPSTWFNQGRYMDDPNEWHRVDTEQKKPYQSYQQPIRARGRTVLG
jgi:hypothetical protein